jgi:hypothetical protein
MQAAICCFDVWYRRLYVDTQASTPARGQETGTSETAQERLMMLFHPTSAAVVQWILEQHASSRFPSFSDSTEHLGKDGLCCQPLGELVHQRAQPVFWHGRDELVEHVTLPEQ